VQFRFDFDKTLQATGVLLEADDNRMETMRLLKLLYISDRELLAETGHPLTGDRVVAMKNGPVLSRVYDTIRGQTAQSDRWLEFVHRDGYKVILRQKPGREKLSKREIGKLTEVTERYRQLGNFELSDETHKFAEWQQHYHEGASTPIPWEDVLRAQGKPEMIAVAEKESETREALAAFFGS
jgi:uncharacterized phage-associated protein